MKVLFMVGDYLKSLSKTRLVKECKFTQTFIQNECLQNNISTRSSLIIIRQYSICTLRKNYFTNSQVLCKYDKFRSQSLLINKFHTSKPNHALPGIFYLIIKPVLRVGAIVFARISRKWWAKLTPEQKTIIYNKMKEHQSKILGFSISGFVLTYIYYFFHLETCPITGRQKFIIVKPNQLNDIVQLTYEALIEEHGQKIIPQTHLAYKRVASILNRLAAANKDYMNLKTRQLNYTITIINDPTINAFVLPDGRIFIFTGMLHMCYTDDELATVLSHELSHTLLNHIAEKVSQKTFLEILFIVPLIFIWFLLPDLGAFITQILLDDLKSVLFELPFDRDMETEADEVGLKLMARACYDVRVASLFWGKMNTKETKDQGGPEISEFLSTHPSHENRQANLQSKLGEALDLRKQCNCLPLSGFSGLVDRNIMNRFRGPGFEPRPVQKIS